MERWTSGTLSPVKTGETKHRTHVRENQQSDKRIIGLEQKRKGVTGDVGGGRALEGEGVQALRNRGGTRMQGLKVPGLDGGGSTLGGVKIRTKLELALLLEWKVHDE